MGITFSNKEISLNHIACGESFKIKLSLTAEPDIVTNPTDIVLVLDRSGSMTGDALENMKNGAKKFVDIIEESTDGNIDGEIGNGSKIGIVSFSDYATQDSQLITSVNDLKIAIDQLQAGGNTNHLDAFVKANDLFDAQSQNKKIIVMFTDGVTTAGGDANAAATIAKNQGTIIYCIGLLGRGGVNEVSLKDWSSDPDSAYVLIAPSDEELEEIFEELAKNISKPGASNIVVRDRVSQCFKIVSVFTPTKGTAMLLNPKELEWKMDELGSLNSEGASLEFEVQHIGPCSGLLEVNESILYEDDEANVVTFPSPSINVDCGVIVTPESCPTAIDIAMEACEDFVEFDAGEILLDSLGRILQLNAVIKNVCPGKRVALGIVLTEVDANGIEHKRGLKTFTIPAHTFSSCRNIKLNCINFVLPEDADMDTTSNSMCNEREFKVRFIAHYMDSEFDCCKVL